MNENLNESLDVNKMVKTNSKKRKVALLFLILFILAAGVLCYLYFSNNTKNGETFKKDTYYSAVYTEPIDGPLADLYYFDTKGHYVMISSTVMFASGEVGTYSINGNKITKNVQYRYYNSNDELVVYEDKSTSSATIKDGVFIMDKDEYKPATKEDYEKILTTRNGYTYKEIVNEYKKNPSKKKDIEDYVDENKEIFEGFIKALASSDTTINMEACNNCDSSAYSITCNNEVSLSSESIKKLSDFFSTYERTYELDYDIGANCSKYTFYITNGSNKYVLEFINGETLVISKNGMFQGDTVYAFPEGIDHNTLINNINTLFSSLN